MSLGSRHRECRGDPAGAPRERFSALAAAALFAACYAGLAAIVFSGGAEPAVLLASALLGAALVALSVIDLRHMRLPDAITLPLAAAGVALAFALRWPEPVWHIAAAAAGYALLAGLAHGYRAIRGRAGLGLGDAKLFAAAGAWLGPLGLPSALLWACGTALLALALWRARGRPLTGSTRIPFGPFLAIGIWLVWLLGPLA
jgi:leader peptidase (prepilin peptidase)/N-methyltransferase